MFAKLAVVSAFAIFVAADTCIKTYVVKPGDICDSISAANNASTYQVAALNPQIDSDCNNLQPGESICLANQNDNCEETYVVQAGDTCDQICNNHNINSTILEGNNPQIMKDCTNLYVGEVLCVANQVNAPPPSGPINTDIPTTATPAVPHALATHSSSTSSSSAEITPPPTTTDAPTSSSTATTSDGGDDEDLPWCNDDEL